MSGASLLATSKERTLKVRVKYTTRMGYKSPMMGDVLEADDQQA